jgi:hypothetical protein
MIYEEHQLDIVLMNSLMEEFIDTYMTFHKKNSEDYEKIKKEKDKSLLKTFKEKFPYLSKGKFCLIHKLFDYPEFLRFRRNEEFKKYLYQNLGKKIRGLFKHGQCAKTEISCTKIIMDMKKGFISIAITKNTLLANKQWTTRCINLMNKNGLTDLKNQIIVISSEFNDLNGNATHCKNLSQAWNKICSNNNGYKVIFVCANKTRVDDVCELINKYYQPIFNSHLRKKIVVQYDEAHNDMYGVPIYRGFVENMLIYDFVEEFIPITASKKPIDDPTNPLWIKEHINKNKLNYVNDDLAKSRIKSDDLNYSSIKDATQIIIEDIYEPTEYDNSISQELFKKHYPTKDYDNLGYVNACPVFLCGNEKLALNTAKKILDNQELQVERQIDDNEIEEGSTKIFKKDEANYHIMITPCRKIITEMLMKYAVIKDYEPVVIGLYNSDINYKYRSSIDSKIKSSVINKDSTTEEKSKEFNEILYNWLKRKNLLNRPVIIFGNYQSLGESNTFVNSDYGYLRSTILLPGCILNEEKHYQFLLRGCFLLEKFTGLTKRTVEKFIISNKKGIDDAIDYENLNDDIVQDLIDNPDESEYAFEYSNSVLSGSSDSRNDNVITYSIPVQFKIEDDSCEYVRKMKQIMEKDLRSPEEKTEFMKNLIEAINEYSIIKYDKNTDYTINLSNFKLTEFRCYKEGNSPENYRFKGYFDKFSVGYRLTNGELNNNECGIYCCLKKHRSSDGHINNPNTFYILFAYNRQHYAIGHDNI